MKKILLTTAITILLFFNLMAQYPCYNGISTNPLNPINTQLSSKKNTFFNWQDSIYQVQPINTDCVRGNQMESPFYKIDNLEELRDSKDMKWDDGWELIRRGFGLTEQGTYTTDPVPNAYFILYNKYTGILRVLLKICRGADYNASKITLSFSPLSQIKTDLLEISRGNISALDKKFSITEFSAGSVYYNDNTKWFYADFPMLYDPCTCLYKSKLNVVSKLISTSQIALEGTISGDIYTKDVGGKAQIQKPGSIGWNDVSGFVNGKLSTANSSINTFITQSQQFALNVGSVDTVNKHSALDNLGNALKNNQFLKAGLNAVPWLKSAVGLFDIFFGGGKTTTGPLEVKLLPLSVNLTARLNGTISTTNPYHNIIFTNPGSKDAQLDPDVYPYYNEVLGVFNLVKRPVAFYKTVPRQLCDVRRCYGSVPDYFYRFEADSLQYVLNPAAEMTIQNMKAAIMIKTYPTIYASTTNMTGVQLNPYFPNFEGKDGTDSSYKFRTDYFDIKCLDNKQQRYLFKTTNSAISTGLSYETNKWNAKVDTLFLKLMINLKRNNAGPNTQNVLLVLTYPLKTVIDATRVDTSATATCDSTIIAPASAAFVNSFCQSSVYNNLDRQSRAYIDSILVEKAVESNGIGLFPNPSKGMFTVKLKSQNGTLLSFHITDISGKRVYSSNEANVNLTNGLIKQFNFNFPNGTYILTAITSKKQLKTKFIIIK